MFRKNAVFADRGCSHEARLNRAWRRRYECRNERTQCAAHSMEENWKQRYGRPSLHGYGMGAELALVPVCMSRNVMWIRVD